MIISGAKYQSYGNDFLVIDVRPEWEDELAGLAQAVCNPHFGVGADGVVFLWPPHGVRHSIRIFNQDGSEAGMSGNGCRCCAAFLHHLEREASGRVLLDTASGLRDYALLGGRYPEWEYRSSMGRPDFRAASIPFAASDPGVEIIRWPLKVAGQDVRITALSVGNPQCTVAVDDLPEESLFQNLGRGLSLHPDFPEGTNVSFVKALDAHSVEIRIWERGVGPTHSSGTGSCGAAVAAIVLGRVQSPVLVRTATGSQSVEWRLGEEVFLTGRVRFVARFEFERG